MWACISIASLVCDCLELALCQVLLLYEVLFAECNYSPGILCQKTVFMTNFIHSTSLNYGHFFLKQITLKPIESRQTLKLSQTISILTNCWVNKKNSFRLINIGQHPWNDIYTDCNMFKVWSWFNHSNVNINIKRNIIFCFDAFEFLKFILNFFFDFLNLTSKIIYEIRIFKMHRGK